MAKGRIRYHHFGEGEYNESEHVIQRLLKENGATSLSEEAISISATGAQAASDDRDLHSPETYIGYRRAEHFASVEPIAENARQVYLPRPRVSLNQWGVGRHMESGH